MTVRLKDVVVTNASTLPETTDPDLDFRYIDIGAVTEGRLEVPAETTRFSSAPSRARRLAAPGDTIVSTVRTYLRAVARVPPTPDPLVFSTGFAVLHPLPERIESRYLSYYCMSQPFVESVVARSVGVSYPAINASDVADVRLDLPALDEQRRIADFLDAETARLDSALAVRERQAELQLERWRRMVSTAVLDVEGDQVPLKHLFGWSFAGVWGTDPGQDDQDVLCARVADFDRENYRVLDVPTVRSVSSLDARRKSLRAGDVLLEKSGGTAAKPVGCAVMYEGRPGAVCSNFIQVLRARPGVSPRFAGYVMAALYETRANGAYVNQTTGIQNLDLGSYLSRKVSVPDAAAQAAAVAGLDAARDHFASARQALVQGACLLAERRQAVITAAVTGQMDVTTARRGPE